jgi:hypothetical protein
MPVKHNEIKIELGVKAIDSKSMMKMQCATRWSANA